jgi:competence protein ComEA
MRSRSLAHDHDAAVSRRLELLTSELEAVRGDSTDGAASGWPRGQTSIHAVPDPEPDAEPDPEHDAGHTAGGDAVHDRVGSGPQPPRVQMPGRHASRRTAAVSESRVGWVPDALRGRVAVGPGQLAVVAVVAVVGLVVTCWFLLRSGAHEVGAPVTVQAPGAQLARPQGSLAPAGALASATGPVAPTSKVVVDVTGKVRRPGIAVLRSGARVVDAIRAAGGARPGVDLGLLNLAQVVTDGEQIVVGGPVAPATGVAAAATGAPPTAAMVHLNTADQAALESLPEVGPVTAQAIIAWRTEHGGFSAVSQLLDVDGIGDATLAQITPFVTL